jgi:hypothetical protein
MCLTVPVFASLCLYVCASLCRLLYVCMWLAVLLTSCMASAVRCSHCSAEFWVQVEEATNILITATSELAQIQDKLTEAVQQGHDAESKLQESNGRHQVAADKATELSKDGGLGPEEADEAMEELMQAQATHPH